MNNIAFYFTHCESLGHATRSFNIIKELNNNNLNTLTFQGGKTQDYLNQHGEVINLPNPSYGRHFFYLRNIKEKDREIIKKRAMLMKKKLDEFKPDVFITELFPFGREDSANEILTIIKYLKNNHPNTKIYASIGYPIISQKTEKLLNITELYDKILIHCPKELDYEFIIQYLKKMTLEKEKIADQTANEYEKIFERLKNKIIFTGYVFNKPKRTEENKDFILISRGGGTVNPKIISNGILAKKYLPEEEFIIVSGPSIPEKEWQLFNKLAKRFEKIKLLKYTGDFQKLLDECKLSISMAGYNTCTETLYLKKKNILFPRTRLDGVPAIEQGYRAELMQEITDSKIMNYNKFNSRNLADEITKKLNEKTDIKIKEEWFNGAEETARIIKNG